MKTLYQVVQDSLRGLLCGSLGGLVAGFLFGLAMTLYASIGSGIWPDSLFEVIFPYVSGALLAGLVGGSLIGGVVGMTLFRTRPHLLRLSQVLGGIVASVPGLFLLNADMPVVVVSIIIGSAAVVGIIGGTTAFQCYERLFE